MAAFSFLYNAALTDAPSFASATAKCWRLVAYLYSSISYRLHMIEMLLILIHDYRYVKVQWKHTERYGRSGSSGGKMLDDSDVGDDI